MQTSSGRLTPSVWALSRRPRSSPSGAGASVLRLRQATGQSTWTALPAQTLMSTRWIIAGKADVVTRSRQSKP